MKPLQTVYWLRFASGVLAAFVCIGYLIAVNGTHFQPNWPFSIFLNSMSLAIIVYIIFYYVIKARFKDKVQKTQKLFTTGIGIYFLAWLVFYALIFTALSGA